MRNLVKAALLTIVLSVPAFAGDMGQPIAPPTGGRPAQASVGPTKTGDIEYPQAGSEFSIALLQSLLALL